MAATPVTLEVRYRPEGSTAAWTVKTFPVDAASIRLTEGITRGIEYSVEARYIGDNGVPSIWVPATVVVQSDVPTGASVLPPAVVGNVGSRWVSGTAVTYSATDTTATISVSAGVLQVADRQINYSASSTTINGTAGEQRLVYLYYDDPFSQGGARTLGVTTDPVASMADHGRILISALQVTFAAAGGSSSGGGDIGGGGGGSGGGTGVSFQPL